MQFYTASARKAKQFSIALTNITEHPPSMFRFPGGVWAVQEEVLSAAAGHAICRLLARGVRCDRITGPMVLAELVGAAGFDRGNGPDMMAAEPAAEVAATRGRRCRSARQTKRMTYRRWEG